MKYAVVFSSLSGNTKAVAEAAAEALPKEDCIYFGSVEQAKVKDADLVLAGFWTDKGTCDEQMASFLSELGGRRGALFGTAGFGGSGDYFDKILKRVSANLPDSARVVGTFMCQGRMPASVKERYEKMIQEKPQDEHIMGMLSNFEAASSHPNGIDFDNMRVFIKSIM